jgi:tRNA(fMet)-specific endonuclease VapC
VKITYLVDTDWIIQYLIGDPAIVSKLRELRPQGLAVSILSVAELYEGVYYSRNPEASQKGVENFLENLSILNINQEICRIFGRQRGNLRRQGNMIGDLDLLIAATCMHHDSTLLTNNVRHFERLEGLRIFPLLP